MSAMNIATTGSDRLDRFITDFTHLMDTRVDEPEILSVGRGPLVDLVSHDDWQPVVCSSNEKPIPP